LITGIVSTIVIILYGFMAGTAEDLFWTLFAFSSMVFLLPYLVMFPAYLKLRDKDKDIERPYRLKGPRWFLALLVVICELFIVQAVVFFVWVPGEPVDWAFAAPVLIGVVLTLVVGEFLIKPAQK